LPHLRTCISIAGPLFLVVMAAGMLRPQRGAPKVLRTSTGSPLLLGAPLALGNPYFFCLVGDRWRQPDPKFGSLWTVGVRCPGRFALDV
jgi:hypothetical protein